MAAVQQQQKVATTSTALVPVQQQQQQRRTNPAAAIDNKKTILPPLDFSFKQLTEFMEIQDEEPRNNKDRKVVRDDDGKYHCNCLRLNNNNITNLTAMAPALKQLFDQPFAFTWVDLSFNELTAIDPVLCDLESLQILYLHGNQIEDLQETVKILQSLPRLHKLTLHGNPVDRIKQYRWYVVSNLRGLKNLDFSCITKADKATAFNIKIPPIKKVKKKTEEAES